MIRQHELRITDHWNTMRIEICFIIVTILLLTGFCKRDNWIVNQTYICNYFDLSTHISKPVCYDHDYFHLKIDFCKSLLLKRSGGWLFDRFTKHSKIAPLMLNRQKPASPIHYPIFYFLRFHVHVWVGSLIFTVTSKHNSARNSDLALRRCVLCRTFDFNLRPWGHLVATQLAYQRSKIQTFLNCVITFEFWILKI